MKRVFDASFWLLILVYFSIYAAYASVVLIWCILGAVLNPQKFLPMAIGAIVFMAFSYRLYSKLTQVYEFVNEKVDEIVDEELSASLLETLSKNQQFSSEPSSVIPASQSTDFHYSLNEYLESHNYPLMDKESIDKIINGDIEFLIDVISKNFGLKYDVSLAVAGMIIENPYTVLSSVQKLSEHFGLHSEFNLILAESMLNKHYLKKTIKQYRVIRPVTKKLVQKMFPNFPVTALDNMHIVMTEGNIEPLVEICDNLGVPFHLFEIAYALKTNDSVLLKDAIFEFKDFLFEDSPHQAKLTEVFEALEVLKNSSTKNPVDKFEVQKMFKESSHLGLHLALTSLKGNKILSKMTIEKVCKKLFERAKTDKYSEPLGDLLLAVHLLYSGEIIDHESLLMEEFPEESKTKIRELISLSKGGTEKLEAFLPRIGVKNHLPLILEF